ncbi:beta-catenin-like protein-like protein 1 [Hyaloscypha bicolor E]|uniref:Beta-catenin-like protein-like protein 1 n=1 Tax=Hyaloscypha bicolor E TaxID=1095630 RepID=A0A2J6TSX3_9HELO|nr:beta-catenin-like protein-like protein 1 [Hyaloscypha bicolor E]PMD66078.1 beta-catenin-like protein-like protein 1 [Hyaloscypha bicolor E]
MSSLDDLFKKPALPSNKRKLDASRDPNEIYKAAKLSANGHAKNNGKAAAVEKADDDVEAGPSTPPDDEDYGPDIPDDEEGRFFGGGVTQEENEILDYMEGQKSAEVAPEKIDSAWLRKLALNFEKKITKNAELRAKFESEPQKFMGSEADLDADIKALSILAEHPELYGEFAKLGCVASLVSLLAHENTDIAIDAVEIISELTDEDVEAEQEQWTVLVDAMIEADLLDLLISNFARLNENNESDRSGIYYALSVLENLASQTSLAEKIGQDTTVLNWLLDRIPEKESPVSQNKRYAAEVMAILLQSSPLNRKKLCELDGVDLLLQILAAYRKRDPLKGTEEEEFVENVFDSLTCVADEPEGKQKFVEAEGVELCLIMIEEGKMSKSRALRLIDHALNGQSGPGVCERLVEAAGLKVVFGMFMKQQDGQTTEHLLGIFSSLLRLLPANSSGRIRTLAKFVEKDYEKLGKLVKLRRDYAARVAVMDNEIRNEQTKMDAEEREEMADEWDSRRLDAGLFCLQTIDVILAWLVAEDDGAYKRIQSLFADRDESLVVVKATIQEQLDAIVGETEEETMTKDMLSTLVQFLT